MEHDEKSSEKGAVAKKIIHSTKNTSNGQNFELADNERVFSPPAYTDAAANSTFDSPYEVNSIVPPAKKALGMTRKSQQVHSKQGGSGISLVHQNFSKTNMKLHLSNNAAQPKEGGRHSTATASYLEKLASEAGVTVETDNKPMTSKSQTRTSSVGKKIKSHASVPSHLRQSSGKVRTQKANSGNTTAQSTTGKIKIQKSDIMKDEQHAIAFQQQIAANQKAIQNLTENMFHKKSGSSPDKYNRH